MIKVLIVEDDPMVAQINKRFVESMPEFKVLGVLSNGEDALKFLTENKVHVVILDVYIPKVDGLKLLEEMRKKFIMTDVIFVTAAKEASSIDEALKLGAVDYLIKPFEYERLKNSLENYLVRYKLLHDKEVFAQEDIDKITNRSQQNISNEIQKGLHRKTLNRIREFMNSMTGEFITSEEVAEKTGLSKVTVRRYLEFLVSIGEIIEEVEYGSIGRPSYLYKKSQRNFK